MRQIFSLPVRQIFPPFLPLKPDAPCVRNYALFILLSALFVLVPLGRSPLGQDLDSKQCYEAVFSEPITWVTSGVWVDDDDAGKALLLVDTYRDADDAVLKISPNGNVEPSLNLKNLAPSPPDKPLQLIGRDGEYWLLDVGRPALISRLNGAFKSWQPPISIENRVLDKVSSDLSLSLMMVHAFTPMASGILAFGDLRGDDGWTSAFLYFEESGHWQIYRTLGTTEIARNYYLQNIPYLASIGDAGYILFLDGNRDGRPVLVKVRPNEAEPRELSIPADFQSWPHPEYERAMLSLMKLSNSPLLGPRQATAFYKVFENAPVTLSGLHAWRNHLYLLGRRMVDKGTASWWLLKLNPRDGTEVSRTRLPTTAAHLTTIPGDFWAFIEKQPVQPVGDFEAPYMRINSMKLVPSEWFEDSFTSGLGIRHCFNFPD